MSRVQSLWLLLALVVFEFNLVQSKQCDWSDDRCLTIAANNINDVVTKGIPGRFEPVDPLFIEKAHGDIGPLHYVVTNATMTGLRHCKVQLLKYVVTDEMRYEYYLNCPELRFNFYYELKGPFNGVELDGAGVGEESEDDYIIILKGKSETYISETDQKQHLVLKEYQTETELTGKYTFENKKLIKGDQDKLDASVAYLNKIANSKERPLVGFRAIIKDFSELYVRAFNAYLKHVPLEDAFSPDYKHPL